MRSRSFIAIVVLLALASISRAQKVVVDVDGKANFSAFKSFGWAPGQIAPKQTTSTLIVTAIERELTSRGLVKNESEPDIRIVVMAAADMDLQGVGPSWNNQLYKSWGGYGNPSAMMTVTSGTLLIDLVETKQNVSVWRGVAKDVFIAPPTGNEAKDVKKMEGVVNQTVAKLFKKYPVKGR